jgi:hypothetical protein
MKDVTVAGALIICATVCLCIGLFMGAEIGFNACLQATTEYLNHSQILIDVNAIEPLNVRDGVFNATFN